MQHSFAIGNAGWILVISCAYPLKSSNVCFSVVFLAINSTSSTSCRTECQSESIGPRMIARSSGRHSGPDFTDRWGLLSGLRVAVAFLWNMKHVGTCSLIANSLPLTAPVLTLEEVSRSRTHFSQDKGKLKEKNKNDVEWCEDKINMIIILCKTPFRTLKDRETLSTLTVHRFCHHILLGPISKYHDVHWFPRSRIEGDMISLQLLLTKETSRDHRQIEERTKDWWKRNSPRGSKTAKIATREPALYQSVCGLQSFKQAAPTGSSRKQLQSLYIKVTKHLQWREPGTALCTRTDRSVEGHHIGM